MTTVSCATRKGDQAHPARIDLKGIKPFSRTIKPRKHARSRAERMERSLVEARAMTPQKLVDEYIESLSATQYGTLMLDSAGPLACLEGATSRINRWHKPGSAGFNMHHRLRPNEHE